MLLVSTHILHVYGEDKDGKWDSFYTPLNTHREALLGAAPLPPRWAIVSIFPGNTACRMVQPRWCQTHPSRRMSKLSEKATEEPAKAEETNPIWLALKAFVTAFVKFWVE
eukprot:TRINITY_DN13221_c0_g1_i4.p1 TRINITY_DN13221_c0_g1~~TRINITY_DN13221_c0_g1_i4.p1  ORF type:complete len:110 (+),score=19.83 TRINITY_DN13221_c0_g1_i4:101-430(+)